VEPAWVRILSAHMIAARFRQVILFGKNGAETCRFAPGWKDERRLWWKYWRYRATRPWATRAMRPGRTQCGCTAAPSRLMRLGRDVMTALPVPLRETEGF